LNGNPTYQTLKSRHIPFSPNYRPYSPPEKGINPVPRNTRIKSKRPVPPVEVVEDPQPSKKRQRFKQAEEDDEEHRPGCCCKKCRALVVDGLTWGQRRKRTDRKQEFGRKRGRPRKTQAEEDDTVQKLEKLAEHPPPPIKKGWSRKRKTPEVPGDDTAASSVKKIKKGPCRQPFLSIYAKVHYLFRFFYLIYIYIYVCRMYMFFCQGISYVYIYIYTMFTILPYFIRHL